MRTVTADTHTWLAARQYLLERCDDLHLRLTVVRHHFSPEAIHDLRVSSRRLREGLALFGHCFRKRRLAPLRRELKALTAMLGSIRNTDEAIAFFASLTTMADVTEIVAALRQQRETELQQLRRELKRLDPGSLLGRIDDLCRNPRIFDPAVNELFEPVAATLRAAVVTGGEGVQALLPSAVIAENATARHRLRIAVKRFRYRFEFMAPLAVVADYQRISRLLKEYQELLGTLHDLDVFRRLAEDLAAPGLRQQLMTAIDTCRQARFTEFLQLQTASPLDRVCAEGGVLL